MDERNTEMREFITATEGLNLAEAEEPITETVVSDVPEMIPASELGDLVFKLRAFMESNDGEFSLGIEMGMQRAADMIENAIRRHRRED